MAANDSVRILVIDDEVRICRVLDRILSRDYEVEVVHSAPEGARRLEEESWSAILCDLRMPEISGMELYRNAVETNPELRGNFIFLSGDLTGAEVQSFLTESGERSIAKPFELGDLRQLVQAVVA